MRQSSPYLQGASASTDRDEVRALEHLRTPWHELEPLAGPLPHCDSDYRAPAIGSMSSTRGPEINEQGGVHGPKCYRAATHRTIQSHA
jgi:hypothetical protein